MGTDDEATMRTMLHEIAPGTVLRDGIDRILRGRTGAIIVLGFDDDVEAISSGGFDLDVEMSATRLRELSKMDGAVVVDRSAGRIRRANVQLMPGSHIDTVESGMRHRTAQRTARQTGHPVISVSQSMRTVALYVGELRHVVVESAEVLAKGELALSALERYRARLDQLLGTFTALEVEDVVTVRDVVTIVQRMEMIRRISSDVESATVQAGTDGHLLRLQHDDLMVGLAFERRSLVRDYVPTGASSGVREALGALSSSDLVDLAGIARTMRLGGPGGADLDTPASPRGHRLIGKIPRLPQAVANAIVSHYDSLQALLAATTDDLQEVEGVGRARAFAVREGLGRVAETSLV
ncbi:DNA integrity scanning diadenylate cyclase DisA [Georgenia sp. Z1344]|uniref:DNA integrity scanning diadenylate cyclase DisA n=1 Tax=Georgenia sp. Z1344 TaxID=3416706 RepID=UPI003CEF4A2E